jgi:hypothetical protein
LVDRRSQCEAKGFSCNRSTSLKPRCSECKVHLHFVAIVAASTGEYLHLQCIGQLTISPAAHRTRKRQFLRSCLRITCQQLELFCTSKNGAHTTRMRHTILLGFPEGVYSHSEANANDRDRYRRAQHTRKYGGELCSCSGQDGRHQFILLTIYLYRFLDLFTTSPR